MQNIYIKIDGITCDHCRATIVKELISFENIKDVIFDGHIAEVQYKGKIDRQKIIDSIIELGYYTDKKMIADNKKVLKRTMSFWELIIIAIMISLISLIINNVLGFNILSMIPTIDSQTTYAMLFVAGLLTSVHCITMCGAINLVVSTSTTKNFKKPVLYNLGRLTSYTLIGGLVGMLGSIIQINAYVQGVIIVIASILMFLMALNMMGIINFSLKFKSSKFLKKIKAKGSFAIGILNGLMPCGPLQAMQIYALSTGSFIYGAFSLFCFALGTIPLMLFVGMISNFLNNKNRKLINKVATVLILVLSLVMLNRGLLNMGMDVSNIFKPNYANYLKSEIKQNYQVVEFDLSYNEYNDIVVQKGIPVRIIINATSNTLTGCNNAIKINAFNIKQDLKVGQNIIEFTPTETGTFTYTCWMSMLKGTILVIDDKASFDENNTNDKSNLINDSNERSNQNEENSNMSITSCH